MTLSPAHERNKAAQADWRALCRADALGDPEQDIAGWCERWFGITPEAFQDSGHARMRKAYNFLRGQVGRLRVLAGEPLELRTIDAAHHLEICAPREDVIFQFAPDCVAATFDRAADIADGAFWGVLERGKRSSGHHLHTLGKPDSWNVGRSSGVIADADLPGLLCYLAKPPVWSPEVALGYVVVKRALEGGRVASRYALRGLPPKRLENITIRQIEATLGFDLAMPKTAPEKSTFPYVPVSSTLVCEDSHFYVGT